MAAVLFVQTLDSVLIQSFFMSKNIGLDITMGNVYGVTLQVLSEKPIASVVMSEAGAAI